MAIAWPLSYETPEERKAFLAAKPFTYIGSLLVRVLLYCGTVAFEGLEFTHFVLSCLLFIGAH